MLQLQNNLLYGHGKLAIDLAVVVYDVYVVLLDQPHRENLCILMYIVDCGYQLYYILYNVQNFQWPLAGGKYIPHFLFSLSPNPFLFISSFQNCLRVFMLAIYKIAIAHIILLLHHRD